VSLSPPPSSKARRPCVIYLQKVTSPEVQVKHLFARRFGRLRSRTSPRAPLSSSTSSTSKEGSHTASTPQSKANSLVKARGSFAPESQAVSAKKVQHPSRSRPEGAARLARKSQRITSVKARSVLCILVSGYQQRSRAASSHRESIARQLGQGLEVAAPKTEESSSVLQLRTTSVKARSSPTTLTCGL
jgi:hypothetical protein